METVPVLLLTGTIGAGKTAVAMEVSDQLLERGVRHGLLDLDLVVEVYPAREHDPATEGLLFANLAAVWRNYRAAGAMRLVLANVLERREDLAGYREAVPGADISVVMLTASDATLTSRIDRREVGSSRDWHMRHSLELARTLDRSVADFVLDTEGRTVIEIAREVLTLIGWD